MATSYGTMYALAVVASFLVTSSLASPSIVGRQTLACTYDGIPNENNFTLLAISKTLPSIWMPLALVSNVSSGSAGSGWIGSPDTATTVVSNYFIMAEGGISATTSEGLTTGASNEVPNESGLLSFALATDTLLPTPAQRVYCVLISTDPHGVEFPYTLSMSNGDSENFSLCQRSNGNESLVVYNAVESSSANAGYIYGTCTEIAVVVLPDRE